MISVIMPVWNGALFMDRAIASVVAQTSPKWELLIVDDGSTDDSLQRAHHWEKLVNTHLGEEKIRVLSTGLANSGPQVGRNLGVEHAHGEFFAYLDQDDLYFPKRIESVFPLFEKFDLVFAPYEVLEKERVVLWNLRGLWERHSYASSSQGHREPSFEKWASSVAQNYELSIPLGTAHRRAIFDEVGGFQPGIITGASGVLWRRMIERGAQIGFCPVVAGRYNVHSDNQSRTRRPFSIGGFGIQQDHPLGSNGQYLDAEWFANLKKSRGVKA